MSEENLVSVECTDVLCAQEPIIQLTENGVVGFEILCRLCANRSDHLISIYSEEGITNDLADKMNLYLPVKVCKTDLLPLQCCFQCASTVLAWHELVIASVEADRRLREIQSEVEKQLAQHTAEAGPSHIEEEKPYVTDDRPTDARTTSLNPFRQDHLHPLPQPQPPHLQGAIKSEPTEISPSAKRRGRSTKPKQQQQQRLKAFASVKIESPAPDLPPEPPADSSPAAGLASSTESGGDLASDGEWIKTELVLESDDVNPFIADCELTEDQELKLSPGLSDNSDFDDLDPEYDPGNETKVKLHACASCGKMFQKMAELRRHAKECPEGVKPEPLESLELHEAEEPQGKSDRKFRREYRCDYCPTVAERKELLKKHVKAEHPDKFDSFNEKRHKERSKIDQEAVNRAKMVVNSRTYYHCDECGKNLHSPYTYIWHNRIHTGERPFMCDLCGKQFRVSQGLVRHLRETHAGIKNFPCDLCGRMFATRRNVEEHRRIHTNERPYICNLCGKTFKQKASLFVHNRSHSDSFPFKCNYCNQAFRTRPPLLVHVTRHTGEKPYACDICGRCFRIKYELKRHRLIHSDDKPFSCTECGLSFRQKRYLRNHNKINHKRPTP